MGVRPAHHGGLRRVQQRGDGIGAHDQAHLLDGGDELEPGRGLAVHVDVLGGARPELRHRLRGRFGHRGAGPAHHHGIERHHDLRGAPPAITSVYGGFKNGDSMSSLTPQPTCSTTATGTSTPSPPTYSSTCSGAADPNYAISYVAGSVTVEKAPLTVTASSGTMSYGGTPPAISSSYSGFVNGDSSSSLTTGATCSTAATGSSGVAGSPYASTCTGVVDPDYAFNYVAGSVTVTKVPLTVTASSGTMTYGGLAPAITPAYGGFVNGDTAASLTTKPTCSTTATSASTVAGSPYGSSCTGTGDPNYTFGYVPGSVTVTQAPLMVTASSGSMTYGSAPPAVTPLYTGFKNGQGASVLAAPPTCTPTATSTSTPSPPTYPTSCPGAAAANYAITYVNGATTVMPAPVDVAVSGSQAFGGSPGFSATPPSPLPSGVTVDTSGVSCGQVAPSTAHRPVPGRRELLARGIVLLGGDVERHRPRHRRG